MNWSGARVFKLPGTPQTFSSNSRRGITRPSFSTKYLKQRHFQLGHADRLVGNGDLESFKIDFCIGELELTNPAGHWDSAFVAAVIDQQILYPHEKFIEIERLGKILIGSDLESAGAIFAQACGR